MKYLGCEVKWIILQEVRLMLTSHPSETLHSLIFVAMSNGSNLDFVISQTYKPSRDMQGLFVPFARVGSGDPVRVYVCYTTNTLDTIEAFIAETYVQLVATESMCYSTSCSTLAEVYW